MELQSSQNEETVQSKERVFEKRLILCCKDMLSGFLRRCLIVVWGVFVTFYWRLAPRPTTSSSPTHGSIV